MKKLVFMFAAIVAVSFASCDEKKAAAPAEGEGEVVATAEDTAAAWEAVGDTTGLAQDSIEAKFNEELAKILEAKKAPAAEEVAEEGAEKAEEVAEEGAEKAEEVAEEGAEKAEEVAEEAAEEAAKQ